MILNTKGRNKFSSSHTDGNEPKAASISWSSQTADLEHQGGRGDPKGKLTRQQRKQQTCESDKPFTMWSAFNTLLGLAGMLVVSGAHCWLVYQFHENHLWFTNIKEVEQEISFRTESGLYYSYYKQLVYSKSLVQGVQDLTEDKLTEHPDTINVLERMNIYQEVILATVYRLCGVNMKPILFYVYSIFSLQLVLVSGLYLLAWFISRSWLAGLLSATLYIFNRLDTTRVSGSGPLRENFSLPFMWLQAAALTVYFQPKPSIMGKRLSLVTVTFSTFLFSLFWQFSQFILMLQGFSLFGVWVLGLLPAHKVCNVLLIQLSSLLAVCFLQFGNKMILGSLSVSFIIVAVPLIHYLGDQKAPYSVPRHLVRVVSLSFLSLVLMAAINTAIKVMASVDSDEHIFKFIQNKFGMGDLRDFDARLYLCLGIFGFITQDVFERLMTNWALPIYIPAHLVMLAWLAYTIVSTWRLQHLKLDGKPKTESDLSDAKCLNSRPELAFHTVQAVFFGALAMLTLRMKYFWTPYICVLAAVGVADTRTWAKILSPFSIRSPFLISVARVSCVVLLLSALVGRLLPPLLEELKVETEFWDPDTVELMEWIVIQTPPGSSFTGSMQLLAGVKLCTGRPVTNHPHYEDKRLRLKTRQLYQIYGRRSAAEVHAILTSYGSNYIILEDSICRAPSRGGCRTPDLVDINNGVMPDEPVNIKQLARSTEPRFCEAVRHQKPDYAKFFRMVLVNRTFRVYKVM